MTVHADNRPFVVGVFIFTGLIILIAAVFAVGSKEKLFTNKFSINVIFDDVGGLQAGNNVWLSGVKIGTVKKISFYGTHQVAVTLHLEQRARSRIYKGARARISSDGFIGNKIVLITGGSPQEGSVTDGDVLQSDKAANTDAMIATLQASNENLLDITNEVRKIVKKTADGQGTLGALINDQTLRSNVLQVFAHLKTSSIKSEQAMTSIRDFAGRLNTDKGLVNELISDTIVFSNVSSAVAQFRETVTGMSALVDSLRNTSRQLNQKDNPLGILLHDQETADNLKALIYNLRTSSVKLDEDLQAIQHNFLFRGYFRKKAKNKIAR